MYERLLVFIFYLCSRINSYRNEEVIVIHAVDGVIYCCAG
jgi:hypothetical protein